MKRTSLVAGIIVLAPVVAACGSSASSGHANAPASTNSAPASTNSAPAVSLPTPSAPASGAPLKLFVINEEGASAAEPSPEGSAGARAAISYINNNLGGLKGRPFQMTLCTDLGTPESTINCANEAADAKPDAVLVVKDDDSGSALPIVAAAGLPFVTMTTGDPTVLDNPDAFILGAGTTPVVASTVEYAKAEGYKSVGILYTNVVSLSNAFDGVVLKLGERAGVKVTAEPVPATTEDLTSAYEALVAKGVDAIYVAATTAQCADALKARESLGDTHPLIMSTSCNDTAVMNTVPASAVNGTVVESWDTSSDHNLPDSKIFEAAMKKYQPSAGTEDYAPIGFATVMDFYNAIETSSGPRDLDAATIKTTLHSARNVPAFLAGSTTLSCGQQYFVGGSAICQSSSFISVYDSGAFKLVNSYNMAGPLKGLNL
jgi:branched-chain amino acid transport system substrate-binding protein